MIPDYAGVPFPLGTPTAVELGASLVADVSAANCAILVDSFPDYGSSTANQTQGESATVPLRGSTKGDLGFGMCWAACHEVGYDLDRHTDNMSPVHIIHQVPTSWQH